MRVYNYMLPTVILHCDCNFCLCETVFLFFLFIFVFKMYFSYFRTIATSEYWHRPVFYFDLLINLTHYFCARSTVNNCILQWATVKSKNGVDNVLASDSINLLVTFVI